jgi:hypothetical protein
MTFSGSNLTNQTRLGPLDAPEGVQFVIIIIWKCSVADPDPGSGAFKTTGSGMNIPDHISESLETIFWIKNT